MNQTPWLLLDNETTGDKTPITVVELAPPSSLCL